MEVFRMENEWKLISLSFKNDDEKIEQRQKRKLILSEEQLS
jgi:hypothetical protein